MRGREVVDGVPTRKPRTTRNKPKLLNTPILHISFPKTNKYLSAGCPYKLQPPSHPSSSNTLLHSYSNDELRSLENRESLATLAVTQLLPNCNFVEAAPLAVEYVPKGRVLHMNFKAKCTLPGSVVETFFAEFIVNNRNVVSCDFVMIIGLSHSVPETADTLGCLYCGSHNIHHPRDESCSCIYRCGREPHWSYLSSQLNKLRNFIYKGVCRHSLYCQLILQFRPKFL